MSERKERQERRAMKIRHKGRMSQIGIYLGKQIRFFVNQNDWKVLPMAAIIAALVGMVIRRRFFINMEGSLMGAFALTCVAIWNGCFNSIQSVCRERPIVKREHRSGMHISSYVAAHMIYQFLLCLLQTGLSVYVLMVSGVKFPEQGFMTPWMIVDVGITMFLITYASDMLSLFISSISHTTTGAMTVMPFVLIFQLVFSGGVIPLPEWSRPISNFTISNYGIKAIAAQSDYNGMPMVTAWNTLNGMRNNEIGGTYTLGQVLDALDNPGLEKFRDREVLPSFTVGEIADLLNGADKMLRLREKEVARPFTLREVSDFILTSDSARELRELELIPASEVTEALTLGGVLESLMKTEGAQELLDREIGRTMTLGEVLDALKVDELAEANRDQKVNSPVTLGMVIDFLKNNEAIQARRDKTFTLKTTVGELIDLVGEEQVKNLIQEKTAAAAYNPDYVRTPENVRKNWFMLVVFALGFALLATISLELIDKDKR